MKTFQVTVIPDNTYPRAPFTVEATNWPTAFRRSAGRYVRENKGARIKVLKLILTVIDYGKKKEAVTE